MSLKRRQFLWLGSAFGGLTLAIATQKLLANAPHLTQFPSASPSPSPHHPISPSPSAPDLRLAVISDLNSRYGSTDYEPEVDKAIAMMSDWQPDLVLCSGDMVAGQSAALTRSDVQAMWDAFDQHVTAPLRQAKIPFGFTIGNHDASGVKANDGSYLFDIDRQVTTEYWHDPQHDPGLEFVDRAGFPFYYTFQHQDVFILVWDASTAQIPSEQLVWVDRSLSSPIAQQAKLRLVIGHLPLYAVALGRDNPGEYLNNAESLRSLLEQHQVHTYISGHDHAYYPGHKGDLQLLNCGILGSGMRSLLNGNFPLKKTLTLVDISFATANTIYTTYDMVTMELIQQQQLPRFIASPGGKVLRRDLEWEDLTPEEQATEYVPTLN